MKSQFLLHEHIDHNVKNKQTNAALTLHHVEKLKVTPTRKLCLSIILSTLYLYSFYVFNA